MSQYHILVVEDDRALRRVIQDILASEGYQTHPARDGQEALEILRWLRADLILSDIMMPVMDGYEFYRQVRLRPEWAHIPFIFLTAKGSKHDVLAGKQLGADDYLTKPFTTDELLVVVGSKLAIAERWRQIQQEEIAAVKRRILNTLNHEFRTPLTYISTYSEILAESGGKLGEKDFREFCQTILSGSRRLQRLVEDFLFLVQLETGEVRMVYESRRAILENYAPWLQLVIHPYQELAAAKGITIRLKLARQLQPVVADTDLLGNALGRLIDNAVKFSPAKAGPIVVTVDLVDQSVRIAVQDRGVGIRPEALSGLFEVLHQVDRDKMEQQGPGFGLAIAKAIVTMHGGQIIVKSQPGVGSTFGILLPVHGPA